MLSYSRGRNINDNHPQQVEVAGFEEFAARLDADRAPAKAGAAYVCGPLNGEGRRCAEGAMRRAWLAVDLDRIEPERLPDVRMKFAGFSGCAWPTHSSKPDAPRERVIVELDRPADRAECIEVGRVLMHDLTTEFGDAVLVDDSTFRPEQPVFVPPTGATLARFFGEPLCVDAYLQAARELPQNAPERPTAHDRGGDALAGVVKGEALHENVGRLVAQWAAKGMSPEAIRAAAVGLLENARRARGDRVDAFAGAELQRLIDGALRKYGPADDAADTMPDFSTWPDGRIAGLFETAPPARAWLCRDRLLAGRGHLLVGVGGSSKTRMLYQLGAGAVLGELPWPWQLDTRGSAALFLAEDAATDAHHVLHRFGELLNLDARRLLAERLRVFPLAGHSPVLLELNGQALRLTAAYGWLMRQLDALPKPVAFVGLDPAISLTEGDELNPTHQRRIGELVDRISIESGACAVVTAHAAKGSLGADELGSHSARGSGAITDALRAEFVLRNMTADEARRFGITDLAERRRYVQLAATKGNHLPPEAFAPLWLQRGPGGALQACDLQPAPRSVVGQRELQALEILRREAADGDSNLKHWRAQCVAAGVIPLGTPVAQKKAMERARDALFAEGLVAPGAFRGSWRPT